MERKKREQAREANIKGRRGKRMEKAGVWRGKTMERRTSKGDKHLGGRNGNADRE